MLNKLDHSYGFYLMISTSMKDILAAISKVRTCLHAFYMHKTFFNHN